MAEFEQELEKYLEANPFATEYCSWLDVDCPLSHYDICTVRPNSEALHQYHNSATSMRGKQVAEIKLDELAKENCPLEETLKVRKQDLR